MKKTVLKICLIIANVLMLFIMIKIYHFFVINKMCNTIKDFRKQENLYYSVESTKNNSFIYQEEVFKKQQIFKYSIKRKNSDLYCEWQNIKTGEKYAFNIDSKEKYDGELSINVHTTLPGLPTIINKNNLLFKTVFDIYAIFPTKYNDKNCYKIITKTEEIIIDKSTNLPIYSKKKIINSENENKNEIEYTYKFRINDVTDEEMALPDLSEYKVIDK